MTRFLEAGNSESGSCKNARIVGLYGIAGVGKTTACMVLADLLNREFQGRACHLVFGNGNIEPQLQLALRQLTGANQDYLHMHINSAAEGWTCLKQRMARQRVFLALDNESDKPESWEVAKKFLHGIEYKVNSMVLVTARSKDTLKKVLGIPESCCLHCPFITTEDAEKIVLNHIGLQNMEILTEEQRHILQKAVEMCDFGGFHPMALKVLATQLGRSPSSWKLSSISLFEASDREHTLFAQMERIFLSLSYKMRDLFVDIALFTPETVNNVHELCLWLMGTLHSSYKTKEEVRKKLNDLRLKSLLEVWSLDSDQVCIHDLHRELAKRRAQLGDASGTSSAVRFVHQTCGKVDLCILEQAERACFVGTSCPELVLDGCSKKLKLLSARNCTNLVKLALQGLARLVSLELSACPMETLDLKDLKQLSWLSLNSCKSLTELDMNGCKSLKSVYISKCDELEALDFKNSSLLESLSVSYNDCLWTVDLSNGNCLRGITLWFCKALRGLQ
ncbi:hypothetical protein L7F22_004848 [Adiantum nelumboides]|nr:hypothetical protein [Adiantum nelumboides]